MSLLSQVIQFRLDSETGPIMLTSHNRSQKDIRQTLEKLAARYPGREIHAVYPADYEPRP